MRRLLATLAVVVALLFSAGSAIADDTSEANKLFVEAVKLVKSVKNVEGYDEKAVVLEEVLGKLNEIVEDYPSTDLAVKLISGQRIGAISLDRISEAINQLRENAEWIRKKPERDEEKQKAAEKRQRERPKLMRVNQIAALIKTQVEANWKLPAGLGNVSDLVVTIRFRLGPDGTVLSAEILDKNYADDSNFRIIAESALRAVWSASPITALRRFSDDYNEWRDVTMRFVPPV